MRTFGTYLSVIALLTLGLGAVASAQPVPAAAPGSADLDAWVGTWNATGTFMGMPAAETVTFEWQAGGWLLEGHHTTTITTADGATLTIQTVTAWRPDPPHLGPHADNSFTGHFYDSTGLSADLTGYAENGTVTFSLIGPGNMPISATVQRGEDGTEHVIEQGTLADGTQQTVIDMTYTQAAE